MLSFTPIQAYLLAVAFLISADRVTEMLRTQDSTLAIEITWPAELNKLAKNVAVGSITVQFRSRDGKITNCLPIVNGWNYTFARSSAN